MSSTPTDADHHGPGPAPVPAHLDDLPPATLVARGLTLRGSRGPVFGSLDLVLPPQTHLAVLGTQGSGRSALLLALTGRLQGVRGELVLTGGPVDVALDGPERPRARRQRGLEPTGPAPTGRPPPDGARRRWPDNGPGNKPTPAAAGMESTGGSPASPTPWWRPSSPRHHGLSTR
mgnify:CR=1 FL=1